MSPPQLYPEDMIRQFFANHIRQREFTVSQISEEVMLSAEKVRRQFKRLAKIGHLSLTIRKGGHRGQANVYIGVVTVSGKKFLKDNGFLAKEGVTNDIEI